MKSTLLKHFLVWFIYQTIQCLIFYMSWPNHWAQMFDNTFQFILYIALFYLLYYSVFKAYSVDKNIIVAIINYLLCFVIILFLVHFSFSYFLPLLGNRDSHIIYYKMGKGLVQDVLSNYIQFSVYAYLYWQFAKRVQLEQVLRVEQTEKLLLANAKLKTEYDYLQSQINPHFLYNTLDFFYAKMLKQDKPTAEGIATLSDLMRYSLDTGNADGKVQLQDEVEQIENYMHLQQMRFNNSLYIQLKHTAIPKGITIIPHALITLVENAFKYGITDDAANPVQINLDATAQKVHFTVTNKISHRNRERGGTGIGLQNLTKRLQLEYSNKCQYLVTTTADTYTTELIIVY
jgi:two-component system, LytTR family, sensor kinase